MAALGKKQWLLIAGALVAAIILFSLPKVVVKQDDAKNGKESALNTEAKPKEAEENKSAAEMPAADTLHAKPMSPELLSKVNTLKTKASSANVSKEKALAFEQLSNLFRENGKFDSAALYMEKRALAAPSPKAFEQAGEAYYEAFTLAIKEEKRNALLAKSQELLSKADASDKNLDAKVKLALTYVEGPAPMKGIGMLREVLAKNPKNELALYNLGQFSIRTQQYDKALGRFEELVKINPKDSRYWFYLGETQMQLGKKAEAKKAFLKVKELNPDPTAIATVDGYLKELGQ